MKKYLAILFSVVLFSPAVFAELSSVDVKEITKEYSNLVSQFATDIAASTEVGGNKHYFDKDYTTREYVPYENQMDHDYGVAKHVPEEKTNKGYYEVIDEIPAGYKIIDNNKSIVMVINGKEVRFELDYTIKSNNNNDSALIDYDKNGFPVLTKNATVTLKYSPKYFKLVPYVYYTPSTQNKTIKYNGNDISLDIKTYAALEFGYEGGTSIYYVLEPNLQNIYTDFEFVHK
ncbi:MAG: hypothetical protein J5594_01550 [Elusimicrobiaceae bacterium]|nr:hypothetical protein [Elusimicrobiaceae bacterium]